MEKKNILIGGAWPYANSDLHLGHIAGLISGDILARYFRLNGHNVMFVSGTDCHGTPITERAKKEKRSPIPHSLCGLSEVYTQQSIACKNEEKFAAKLFCSRCINGKR